MIIKNRPFLHAIEINASLMRTDGGGRKGGGARARSTRRRTRRPATQSTGLHYDGDKRLIKFLSGPGHGHIRRRELSVFRRVYRRRRVRVSRVAGKTRPPLRHERARARLCFDVRSTFRKKTNITVSNRRQNALSVLAFCRHVRVRLPVNLVKQSPKALSEEKRLKSVKFFT